MQTFSKYFSRSNTELLFTVLRQMMHEAIALKRNKARTMGDDSEHFIHKIEVDESEFVKKARQLDVYHLKNFYDSKAFKNQKYAYDPVQKVIIQTF